MPNFIPYPGRIHFDPMHEKSAYSDEGDVIEAGKVISIGEGVTFTKPGDTVFFLRWGAEQTPEIDGKQYWTLLDDKRFIMGVLRNENAI